MLRARIIYPPMKEPPIHPPLYQQEKKMMLSIAGRIFTDVLSIESVSSLTAAINGKSREG